MSDEITDKKPDESTSQAEGKNADGSNAGKDTQTPKPEDAPKQFTQAELNDIIKHRLSEERNKLKNDFQKQRDEEERKRKEQEDEAAGKHQELANTRAQERDAAIRERDEANGKMESLQAKYDALAELVSKSVASEIKHLPEHLRELAPPETSLDARLEWLPKAKKAAQKEAEREPVPGNGRSPKPTNAPGTAEADKAARAPQSQMYRDL